MSLARENIRLLFSLSKAKALFKNFDSIFRKMKLPPDADPVLNEVYCKLLSDLVSLYKTSELAVPVFLYASMMGDNRENAEEMI